MATSIQPDTSHLFPFSVSKANQRRRLQRPFKISVLRSAFITPNQLKLNAFQPAPSNLADPPRSFKSSRKVRPPQYIQRVTLSPSLSRAPPNCKTLQFLSILSDPHLARDPLSGAAWAYCFAVIHFCKKFYWCGAQAGADERGFRDADAAVGVAAVCWEAVSMLRLHV